MRFALFLRSVDVPTSVGDLLLRVRDWFWARRSSGCKPVIRLTPVARAAEHDGEMPSARLLPFPIRGEALLVRLADLLRARVAALAPCPNPFLLTMQRIPGSRLLIDQSSYIEYRADQSVFRVVVKAAADTLVTMDTTDFDTLVQFVVQYVSGRLSEASTLEAAS